MTIRTVITTLTTGILFLHGAAAGTQWQAPAPDKCPIEDCPDVGGNISVGYDSAYIWKGIRWARDSVWGDVNYTFSDLPFSPNIGVWHLSSLGSGGPFGNDAYGDEFNAYASISLPSVLGFDRSLGYTWYTFPAAGVNVDSLSVPSFSLSRELLWGIEFGYTAEYFTGQSFISDWFHTFGVSKAFELTDRVGLELSGEVGYTDDIWAGAQITPGRGSGWNHYGLRAGLPIALNCRATLTPYVAYNGSPDGWRADHLHGIGNLGGGPNQGANANDVFSGGVSIGVDF